MDGHSLNASDPMCGEIEEKNRVLNDYAADRKSAGDKDAVIQVRIHQLAISKLLVNIHNRSPFILVEGHTNLGEAYLAFKYYEQALEHLTLALRLNGSLFNEVEESKPFHAHILTILGKCYKDAGGLDDALGLLEKALTLNQSFVGENHISNSPIHSVRAQVYIKKKDFKQALDALTSVWELHEATYGINHESMPSIYIEMAKVYAKLKDMSNAIDMQKRALAVLTELDIHTEKTAKVAITLAEWSQDNNDFPEAIDAFRTAEQVYEANYGQIDKKTAKIKRKICMLLLKAEEYNEALEESMELEEIGRHLHGEQSLQFAKNLKIIATISMIVKKKDQASEYFNRAIQIFKKFKTGKKIVQEIKEKLKKLEELESPREFNVYDTVSEKSI